MPFTEITRPHQKRLMREGGHSGSPHSGTPGSYSVQLSGGLGWRWGPGGRWLMDDLDAMVGVSSGE